MRREPAVFCSTAFDDAEFRSHGRTRVQLDGRLLRIEAWGPFNLELVKAQGRLLHSQVGPNLPPDGRFVESISYHQSILMPEEAWQALYALVTLTVERGVCAQATVIQVDENVEGAGLFAERLAGAWRGSRPVQLVSSREALEQAVAEALAALQDSGSSI